MDRSKQSIKILFSLITFLLLIPMSFAASGHMTLLAVSETNVGFEGHSADLYLEVRPGTGRVLVDTFPLTKFDTQLSTRFAKEIACNFLNVKCDDLDFIYTIRADSTIIGGPSAGAATAALTVIVLDNQKWNTDITDVALTGTINSGDIVGSVGGLEGKIDAASKTGITKVLIPKGEIKESIKNKTNEVFVLNQSINKILDQSIDENITDLRIIAGRKNVTLVEVSDLNEALYQITGKTYQTNSGILKVNSEYIEVMKQLSIELCNRSDEIIHQIGKQKTKFDNSSEVFNLTKSLIENGINLTIKSKSAFDLENYYSSASYCYGANVKLHHALLLKSNLSDIKIFQRLDLLKQGITEFEESVDKKKYNTITDLQTYMIVKERINEAKDYRQKALDLFNENGSIKESVITKITRKNNANLTEENARKMYLLLVNGTITKDKTQGLYYLAYSIERLKSAASWYKFYGTPGTEFNIDITTLKQSCISKISEAEERFQYIKLLFPGPLDTIKKEMDDAYNYKKSEDYELCLFSASKAKSESDLLLNLLGVEGDQVKELTKKKLEVANNVIIKQINQGVFPLLGYSYYEYAKNLLESDSSSALLYSEYALELSNFDLYFKESNNKKMPNVSIKLAIYKYAGVLLLVLICVLIGLIIGVRIGAKGYKESIIKKIKR